MTGAFLSTRTRLLPFLVLLGALALWAVLSATRAFPDYLFPAPWMVASGFVEELQSGRLPDDIIASLFRVTSGFCLAVALGVPAGLWLGRNALARAAFLPSINFLRNLSPIAWIPFAILWFRIGDKPAIFLIFMATFFPLVLATLSAVANIPTVYFRVGADYGFKPREMLLHITLPAILPQLITTLRVTAGLAWLVVVAAEMIAPENGLGAAIHDARNAQRIDLVVVEMIIIGLIGVAIDKLLVRLTTIPSVRWGYER